MAVLADILKPLDTIDSLPDGERQKTLLAVADRITTQAGAETIALADTGGLAESQLRETSWFAHNANISRHRATRIIGTARLADRFDAISEAINEGVLKEDHITVLKNCLPRTRTRYRSAMFDDFHKQLIDYAREFDYPEFKKLYEAWIGMCEDTDPDTKAPEDRDLGVDFSDNLDGTTNITGLLLTSDAQLFKEMLDRLAAKAREDYRREQKVQPEPGTDIVPYAGGDVEPFDNGDGDIQPAGDGGDDLSVDRSISEYTLRPVVRRGLRYWMARSVGKLATLAGTAPQAGKAPEPLLVVLMDLNTLETAKERWATNDESIPPDIVFRPGYVCETLDGQPIHPATAFRIALYNRLQRCLIDAESLRVDLGRTSRLFKGAARDAIIYRDRHCDIPGCRAPARWCEVDHHHEWQDLGVTDSPNGKLYCGPHHTQKTLREEQHRQHKRRVEQARKDQQNTEPF